MPAGYFQAAVVCALELNGHAIEPIDDHGRGWPACAHSTQKLPTPHTPAADRRRPGRTDRQLK
jgi:hypothetical protein